MEHTNSLMYWPELRRLSTKILEKMIMFYVDSLGQLLIWDTDDCVYQADYLSVELDLKELSLLSKQRVQQVVSGKHYTLALDFPGQVWSWDCNFREAFSLGNRQPLFCPTVHIFPEPIRLIRACGYLSAAIDTRHKVWIWNQNVLNRYDRIQPERVDLLFQVSDLQIYKDLLVLLCRKGNLYCYYGDKFVKQIVLNNQLIALAMASTSNAIFVLAHDCCIYWTYLDALYQYRVSELYLHKLNINEPIESVFSAGSVAVLSTVRKPKTCYVVSNVSGPMVARATSLNSVADIAAMFDQSGGREHTPALTIISKRAHLSVDCSLNNPLHSNVTLTFIRGSNRRVIYTQRELLSIIQMEWTSRPHFSNEQSALRIDRFQYSVLLAYLHYRCTLQLDLVLDFTTVEFFQKLYLMLVKGPQAVPLCDPVIWQIRSLSPANFIKFIKRGQYNCMNPNPFMKCITRCVHRFLWALLQCQKRVGNESNYTYNQYVSRVLFALKHWSFPCPEVGSEGSPLAEINIEDHFNTDVAVIVALNEEDVDHETTESSEESEELITWSTNSDSDLHLSINANSSTSSSSDSSLSILMYSSI